MALKREKALRFQADSAQCLLCPDMGGRIFGECCGKNLHRIDLECARQPSASFNNYGGNNFWPAPEGGKFGCNYRGNEWYVQKSINEQPFQVVSAGKRAAVVGKEIKIVNRAGTLLAATMRREFTLLAKPPECFNKQPLKGFLSYSTVDSFKVHDAVSAEQALVASWTLEQFEATNDTLSFCVVPNSKSSINFDFYEHPGDKIRYYEKGFTYRTDGRRKGQIGIKARSKALFIGFIDRGRNLVCLRQNLGPKDGTFFNIADNDQPRGPYSAADEYSIFNSDETMQAFELETVGSAQIQDNVLKGSTMTSATSFAVFENPKHIDDFLDEYLGTIFTPSVWHKAGSKNHRAR